MPEENFRDESIGTFPDDSDRRGTFRVAGSGELFRRAECLRHSGDAGITGAIQCAGAADGAACGAGLENYRGVRSPVSAGICRRQNSGFRSAVECGAYLCARSGGGVSGFRGNFAAAPVGTARGDVCGRVDCARGARRQNRGTRGGDQFARASDEFRAEFGRRRAGGFSNVFRDQASVRRVGDGVRGAVRDRAADSLCGARLAVDVQRR